MEVVIKDTGEIIEVNKIIDTSVIFPEEYYIDVSNGNLYNVKDVEEL